MEICEDCRSLLWDELYGLLDASDSDSLRRHLAGCAACRAEMVQAEAHQRLVARVARLNIDVPVFKLPVAETSPLEQNHQLAAIPMVRRFSPRRRLVAAAAVLLCTGAVLYGMYRGRLNEHTLAVKAAETRVADAKAKEEAEIKQFESQWRIEQEQALARHVRLRVLGPATYQPGVLSQYRILATGLDGQTRPVDLTARLSDSDRNVLFEKKLAGNGELLVSLPADLKLKPRTSAEIEFIADASHERVRFDKVSVLDSQYMTRLVTDKAVYHAGETIYFRSLTVEPATFKPAGRDFNVTYTLMAPNSARLKSVKGRTLPGGIGGGTFELGTAAAPGNYTITATNTIENRFLPVSRTIVVQPAQVVSEAVGKAVAKIEVFPEGGGLVAGFANRIYFRLPAAKKIHADVTGQVIDSRGQRVAAINLGTDRNDSAHIEGAFTFTPAAGEQYRFQVTSAAGISQAVLPAAQTDGVGLTTPSSVMSEGEELSLILHSTEARQLVVAVSCRGGLVAQESVAVKPGRNEVKLQPAAGAHGVFRVSVLDARHEVLQPVAERLVYCVAAKQAPIDISLDKKSYRPGDRVTLTIQSGDEKRQPEQSWLLVSTGKRDALSQADGWPRPGLPLALAFSSGLDQPREIEQAYFEVGPDARSRAALDLFLGTQGWRPVAAVAQNDAVAAASGIALFALDNLGDVQKAHQAELKEQWQTARSALASRLHDLNDEDARLALSSANLELSRFEQRVQEVARLSLGIGALMLLAIGAALLAAALWGMARHSPRYRRRLVGAFAALLPCLLIVPLSRTTGETELAGIKPADAAGIRIPEFADLAGANSLQTAESAVSSGPKVLPIAPRSGPVGAEIRPAQPVSLQDFVYRRTASQPAPDTLLWKPVVSAMGSARVALDLPVEPGVYTIHVERSTESGALGVAEVSIDTRGKAK